MSIFVRKHFALLLGGVPLVLAGIRVVVVSQGDYAVMAALIQTLNLSTVVMYTVTTTGPIAVFYRYCTRHGRRRRAPQSALCT